MTRRTSRLEETRRSSYVGQSAVCPAELPKVVAKKRIPTPGKSRRSIPKCHPAAPARAGDVVRGHGASRKRVDAVIDAARQSGLLGEKSGRIAGRVSPALVERAKKLTGIATDTELIEFALANVALEDDFPDAFRKLKGTLDPSLDLEF